MNDRPLRLENVSHSFGSFHVLREIRLEITRGEFVVLVGPSGCGKTTLLNLMAGFYQPNSGTIARTCTTHMVYQSDGLFPWFTVEENIGLGLRNLEDKAKREEALASLIALIQLEGF